MASSSISFPNDINNAPLCSICLEAVLDNIGRSITKLHCGHFFHTDCIGSEFNARGTMQCPNCRTVEDGNWLLFGDSEDEESEEQQNNEIEVSDSDDDDDEYEDDEPLSPEDQLDFLVWMEESDNNRGPTITRQENLDPSGQTFLIQGSTLHFENDGRTTFSSTSVVNNIGSVGSVSMSYEPPPPPPPTYEQTRCNPLPSLELTLAISTSVDVEHQLPCCCYRCRPSTSRTC